MHDLLHKRAHSAQIGPAHVFFSLHVFFLVRNPYLYSAQAELRDFKILDTYINHRR